MVAVGVLRGPHRRHGAERVDRRGVHPLEHHPLGRDPVDLGGRRPGVAVGPERLGPPGVEDDQEHVGAGHRLSQRLGARVVGRGDRGRLQRVAPAHAEDPGRDEAAPGEARAARGAHREADPDDVAGLPGEPHDLLARGLRARVDHARPGLALGPSDALHGHAEGRGARRGAGRGEELGREAQLGRGRQLQREAHDRGAEHGERGDALLVAHGEGPRGVAPEQVLERGVGGGAGDEGVEGGAQLPLVEAPGLHVGRRCRGREHEPQAVVARLLRRGGQRDPIAVAGVVELEPLDHRPVEAHLDRRLLHPAVRGRVEDRDARGDGVPLEGHLGLSLRPEERLFGAARLAVEAVGQPWLGRRRPEAQDVRPRPRLGHRHPRREVVHHRLRPRRAADPGQGEAETGERGETAAHFTFVPGATSASKEQSTALPSIDPASTMPFDSTPISFAGLRFATTMTVLPTRASAS